MGKLFGKFQKLSARPTGGETSTGLGLSIVKKYVEAMQGNIHCENNQGQGAKFVLTFSKYPLPHTQMIEQ
jgi:signal transduction histidine kinase